jgi:hypothetical protein
MPNNDSMGTEFQNAAERDDFNARLARARELKNKPEEDPAPPPADPVKALEEKLPEDRREAFVSYVQKWGKRAAAVNRGMVDMTAEATGQKGSLAEKGGKAAATASGYVVPDVANAVLHPVNTAQQVPSGILNAWNEINEFGNDVSMLAEDALGGVPVYGGPGQPVAWQSKEFRDLLRQAGAETPLTVQNEFDEPVSMTGALVEGISQFAAPYSAYNKALGAVELLAKPGAWTEMSRAAIAGFMTDFSAFDPELQRLTDVVDQMGLDVSAVEYLKSDEDDSAWESRFKNALEGLGLGVAGEMLFRTLRSGKAIKKTEQALGERLAYMEKLDSEASTRFQDDIYAHGDPDGAKVEFSTPPKARTEADLAAAKAERPAPEPVTNGERFYEQDYFELNQAPKGADDKFAFGEVPDKQRFLSEETVARSYDGGDIFGFQTRTGDVAVMFDRGTTTTMVGWDWMDNIVNSTQLQTREDMARLNLQDANELVSKVSAILGSGCRYLEQPVLFLLRCQ